MNAADVPLALQFRVIREARLGETHRLFEPDQSGPNLVRSKDLYARPGRSWL
jgi:hypothetical protein